MKITRERLATKGWSDAEINKTIKLLEKAKNKRHPHIVMLDKVVYWIALFPVQQPRWRRWIDASPRRPQARFDLPARRCGSHYRPVLL